MKAYVVTSNVYDHCDYNSFCVVKVFDSREKAEKYCQQLKMDDVNILPSFMSEDFSIEEFELE